MTSNDDNGTASSAERLVSSNFITDIVEADLASGRHRTVVTRFPPEPNGYAHLGHAFASYLDFGIAHDYGGRCNLRFDDTNPEVEEMRYVSSIEEDLRWLGWTWPKTLFSSDYFERLYELALRLVEMGDAYVDSSSSDEIQRLRGTVDRPGTPSPYRDRGTEENLDLFRRMRAGEFPNGSHVLRARIDMASPNMKMRDPLLYRIVHAEHYRTGSAWPIYPFYDFQHPLSDAIEGVTHSLCSLEFVDNRELYDWLVDRLFPDQERPRQYEFGRRNLEYTVVSKRRLMALVRGGHVSGWDDPRMPTLAGLRRAGVRPEAVRDFASRIGVSRTNRTVDIALLEHSVRDDLNGVAKRVMAVTQPLRVVLGNVDTERWLDAPYWPPDVDRSGSREVPFGRELAIERSDFAEHPPKGWRRLSPAPRCGCATPSSSAATRSCGTRTATPRSCAARPCWTPWARTLRASRWRAPSTGSTPGTRCRPSCASTTGCSPCRTPAPAAATSSTTSTRHPWWSATAWSSRAWRKTLTARATSSNGWGTSGGIRSTVEARPRPATGPPPGPLTGPPTCPAMGRAPGWILSWAPGPSTRPRRWCSTAS